MGPVQVHRGTGLPRGTPFQWLPSALEGQEAILEASRTKDVRCGGLKHMANSANSPSVVPNGVIDPASPVGMADSNVKNAESILDPVLGVAPDLAAVKKAVRPKHAALSLIPMVLQEAVIKPYLAPKGTDPVALLQELALLQSLMVVAHDAGALKLRVDHTV